MLLMITVISGAAKIQKFTMLFIVFFYTENHFLGYSQRHCCKIGCQLEFKSLQLLCIFGYVQFALLDAHNIKYIVFNLAIAWIYCSLMLIILLYQLNKPFPIYLSPNFVVCCQLLRTSVFKVTTVSSINKLFYSLDSVLHNVHNVLHNKLYMYIVL